jgi:hypothetical protein
VPSLPPSQNRWVKRSGDLLVPGTNESLAAEVEAPLSEERECRILQPKCAYKTHVCRFRHQCQARRQSHEVGAFVDGLEPQRSHRPTGQQ